MISTIWLVFIGTSCFMIVYFQGHVCVRSVCVREVTPGKLVSTTKQPAKTTLAYVFVLISSALCTDYLSGKKSRREKKTIPKYFALFWGLMRF